MRQFGFSTLVFSRFSLCFFGHSFSGEFSKNLLQCGRCPIGPGPLSLGSSLVTARLLFLYPLTKPSRALGHRQEGGSDQPGRGIVRIDWCRRQRTKALTQVIAMTGDSESGNRLTTAKLLGARSGLKKPFSVDTVLNLVRYELGRLAEATILTRDQQI